MRATNSHEPHMVHKWRPHTKFEGGLQSLHDVEADALKSHRLQRSRN